MAMITTGMQMFSQIFSALRDGVMWLISCFWEYQVWLWTGLYRIAVAVYDVVAMLVLPVWRFWARIQAGVFSALAKIIMAGYALLQKGWQFYLACWRGFLSWLYSWIKPFWLPLREDLLPLWHFVRSCVATLTSSLSHWFSLVVKLLGRLQGAIVYYLQIPASYTGLWQSAVISLVGTLLQKVWEVPKEIESVLSHTPFVQKWHRWVWHAVGALTFFLSGLVMWPYMYGVVVLPFSPHHLQWFVLAPAIFFPIRGFLRRGVDLFSARVTVMTANFIHEAASLVFSLAGVWLANSVLLVAAPAASPFICSVSAATWAWFYLARPQAPKWVWYPGVLTVCAGPLLYYLAMMGFIAVAGIASAYLSVLVFTHALYPLVYELVLSAVAIFGIGLCGYAMVKEMPTWRTWCTVLLAMVFGPPVVTVLFLGLPYLALLLISNSFLLYSLLGTLASCILLLGARYLDRWVYGSLAGKKPNVVNIFSSMTVLYAYVFFSLYAFCFVVPTFAMKVLPVMMVGLLSMGLTFVYTIYAVDRLSDMLHAFSPKHADPSGTRQWFFSALCLSIVGNLGFTMPMFSWLPVMITNVTGGILIGLGVGLVSAFSAVCFLRSFFPRAEIRHLHSCLISGSALVLAPWALWHVVHMPLSSIVITMVLIKMLAIFMACRNLWATIPVFYQHDPEPGSGGFGSGPASTGGGGPGHKAGHKGEGPDDYAPSDPFSPTSGAGGSNGVTFPQPSAPPHPGSDAGGPKGVNGHQVSTALSSLDGTYNGPLPTDSAGTNYSLLFDNRRPGSYNPSFLHNMPGMMWHSGQNVPFTSGSGDANERVNEPTSVTPSAPPLLEDGEHVVSRGATFFPGFFLPVAYPVNQSTQQTSNLSGEHDHSPSSTSSANWNSGK